MSSTDEQLESDWGTPEWEARERARAEEAEGERIAWEAERAMYEAEVARLESQIKDDEERKLTSWAPVDLDALAAGDLSVPRPVILTRTDGQALLYPGRTHSFIGESEHGKTLAAYLACAQVLLAGRGVVYVDFEGEPTDYLRWMRSLGVPTEAVLEQSRYVHPEDPIDNAGKLAIRRACLAVEPQLVVFDGVTEAMMLHGLDDNKTTDTAQFMQLFPRRFERAGVTTLLIDHAPHDGRRAIGSQHKRAAVTGASYLFQRRAPLAPGRHGKVDITVLKDRPGQVRAAIPSGSSVGTLHIQPVPEQPGRVQMRIEPAGMLASTRPVGAMERVSLWLEEHGRSSRRAASKDAPGHNEDNEAALDMLVLEDWVQVEEELHGSRVDRYYTVVRPFRDGDASLAPDPPATSL